MRQNGRMRRPMEASAIGSLPGASRGYLPLLPTACVAVCLAAGSLYWREAPPRAPEGTSPRCSRCRRATSSASAPRATAGRARPTRSNSSGNSR